MLLSNAIIGLVLCALFAVPAFILYRNRKKQQQQLYYELNKIALANGVVLGDVDYGIDYAIGIDTKEQHVMFYRKSKTGEQKKFVRLANLRYVHTNKVTANGKPDASIRRIELAFQPKDYSKATHYFDLFDDDENQLGIELEQARKWEARLSKLILF